MIEAIAHRYIPLPAQGRDQVLPALVRAGIELEPSTRRHPMRHGGMADYQRIWLAAARPVWASATKLPGRQNRSEVRDGATDSGGAI